MSQNPWPIVETVNAAWRRGLAFVVAVVALYAGGLVAFSRVSLDEHSLLARMTGHDLAPGGRFQSLRRFREADSVGRVDVVFLGSSHAYRGFDPRIFSEAGVRAFNLGSTNQTPLNAHYVAARYLPAMRPGLVVVELYPHNLVHDGLESSRDLMVNTPFHASQLAMAVSTRQLGAVHYAVARGMGVTPRLDGVEQRPIAGETYISGGYCETRRARTRLRSSSERLAVRLSDAQRHHLVALSRLAQEQGARVVWVTHPLPSDHLALIDGRPELRAALHAAAVEAGAVYWDYDERLELDPREDFMDFHHLNQRGVERFNAKLIEDLRREGYWPR